MLQGKHSSGAGKPSLDFIQDEESSRFAATLLDSGEIVAGARPDATFSLDYLDQERCDTRGDGLTGFGEIIERHMREARYQRFKRLPVFFVPGGAEGFAMVPPHRSDDFSSTGR